MRLAVISDTHMPRGGRRLPDACAAEIRKADLVVHAGDLVQLSVLSELEDLARGDVVAVHGNVDDEQTRHALPATAEVEIECRRIAVVHDGGPARGRLNRLRTRFPHADAVIFGHSHMPLLERAPDGFQIFNPGSPTERRRAPQRTMGIATVTPDELRFELVCLG